MCGIAGLMSFTGKPVQERDLARMVRALSHRGPDGEGVHLSETVGLGHRRLSIIDLESGKQPLSNEDGSVWVTFNGEIYNFAELRERLTGLGHVFRTRSDTEVIVHAYEQWGVDCVSQLRGMFALAIWDANPRQLFLARDRLGIKPLLYWADREGIAFASEMQALATNPSFPAAIDLAAVDQYLHYQYIPAPNSIYQQVKKLPPAHFMIVHEDGSIIGPSRYWQLGFHPDRSLTQSQWMERLDEALDETIRAHCVADVPFGAFLSGGIDSSMVVRYMSRNCSQPVKAFCIGHADSAFDERKWARQAAQTCGAEYIEEVIEEDSLDLLPALVRHYGEPFADSSALPTYYVSRLASQHVKMVLSGDGGDELFAGYHAYAAILWEHRFPTSPYLRTRHRLANAARQLGIWPPVNTPEDSKYARTTPFPPLSRSDLWRPEHRAITSCTRQDFAARYRSASQKDLLNSLQAFDLENYIPYDNLTKVDIASMVHGLEVRVPLLDYKFVETMASVPPEFKLSGLEPNGRFSSPPAHVVGKRLLKDMARREFGDEFVERPKRGFEVPIQSWFTGRRGEEQLARITDSTLPMYDWFDLEALRRCVRNAADDKLSAWNAWSLLVLAEWCAQIPEFSAADAA